jgi:hypothetical protein
VGGGQPGGRTLVSGPTGVAEHAPGVHADVDEGSATVPDRRRSGMSTRSRSVRPSMATQRSAAHGRASRHMGQILGPPGMTTSAVTLKPWRPYKARFRSLEDSR